MTARLKDIVRITKTLPEDKAAELYDFARFLQQQSRPVRRRKPASKRKKVDGDAEWERIIADTRPKPKLEAEIARVRKAIAAGNTKPMDFDRL